MELLLVNRERCNHPMLVVQGGHIYGGSVFNMPDNMHHYFLLDARARYQRPWVTVCDIPNGGVPYNKKF